MCVILNLCAYNTKFNNINDICTRKVNTRYIILLYAIKTWLLNYKILK